MLTKAAVRVVIIGLPFFIALKNDTPLLFAHDNNRYFRSILNV